MLIRALKLVLGVITGPKREDISAVSEVYIDNRLKSRSRLFLTK
jgi:hypothetical protein